MRLRLSIAAVLAVALAAATGASAEPSARLDRRHPRVTLTGHLQGASTYGPFYPLGGPAFDRTCVDLGCQDHDLVVVVPAGTQGRLDWGVEAPATGPGVDLRILDENGDDITRRGGGSIDTPTPTTGTYGSVRSIRPGRYTVRVSVMAGVTDYEARLQLSLI